MTRSHGCHNRPQLQSKLMVQDGWIWPTPHNRVPRMVQITDPMSKSCQHIKHAPSDPGCAGCRWKPNTPPHWLTYDPVRACRLCTHGGAGRCERLNQPFEPAREPGGPCVYLELKQC